MKFIRKLNDMEAFGIVPLTGEADALSLRILCDLTEQGVKIVQMALGLATTTAKPDEPPPGFLPPWNTSTNGHQHVACIMLDYDAWKHLAVFALGLDQAGKIVVYKTGVVCGFYFPGDEEDFENAVESRNTASLGWARLFDGWAKKPNGDRNRHVMSGRVS